MNIQAAKSTFLIVAALTMTTLGFYGMLAVAPEFTIWSLLIGALAFLVNAVYRIEKGRIESLERLNKISQQ